MEDSILIQKCQQGERKAQRWLYDKYYLYIYKTVFRYVRRHHDAEDVISEVFVRIFKNIGKLKATEDLGLLRWVKTIAINEAIRFMQKKQRLVFTDSEELFQHQASNEPYEDIAEVDLIKKIIDQMPDGYRTIFLLNVVEGLSHTEIAEHLDISRNTSKSQMIKARKYIQRKLNKDESRQFR